VKSDAFALALNGEDEDLISKFVTYHQLNGGVSRYVKFEYFYEKIKKQSEYQSDLALSLERYGELSKRGLLECDEIPGIRDILRYFKLNKIPCYVASGGDQNEVREVLDVREFSQLFDGIYGSPKSKIENLELLNSVGKITEPMVYFGDAHSDLVAANKFNMDFVFIKGVSEWSSGQNECELQGIPIADDFIKLLED
jgi:phosphoglycolate phosphatase-like HAD superfamily hydrolase